MLKAAAGSWSSRVAFEGSCRQGARGEVEEEHVPGSVAWGQEQGAMSLAAGCSPRQHRTLPPALAKAAKIPFLPLGSLLYSFSVRSEQMEYKALKEKKKKGKPLIVKGLLVLVLSDQACTWCRTPCTWQGLMQPQLLQMARYWRKGVKINLFLIPLGDAIFLLTGY